MAGEVRPIAMGVGKIKFGTVGDGVPGADLKDFPLPTKGSVAFNFTYAHSDRSYFSCHNY